MINHEPTTPKIDLPVVPLDARVPQTDLDEELRKNNEALLACKDDQIKQLTEIVEIQKKMIAVLENQVHSLLYDGGGCCSGSGQRGDPQ